MMISATTIGRRLRALREYSRLDAGSIADAVGVSVEALEAIEEGRGLTSLTLSRVAQFYGLLDSDILAESFTPKTAVGALFRGEPGRSLLSHVGRFASIAREQAALEALLGVPKPTWISKFSAAGPPSDPPWGDGKRFAGMARKKLELGYAPIRSMSGLLTRIGIRLLWTAQDDWSAQGLTLYDDRTGPTVVINVAGCKEQWWWMRTTLAHELCHVLFDHEPARPLGVVSRRDSRVPVEQRANAFAAYFLAPEVEVERFLKARGCPRKELTQLDVHALMAHFGIGKETATAHLQNLDWISREQRHRLLTKSYPVGWKADTESPWEQPDTARFWDAGVELERLSVAEPAMRAYARGLITEGYLREVLGLSPFANMDPLIEHIRPTGI